MDRGLYDRLRLVGSPLAPERPRRNPFRNEADAFRILVMVGIVAAIVIVVAAVFGATAGALLGLVFLCLGGYFALRWLRFELEARDAEDER